MSRYVPDDWVTGCHGLPAEPVNVCFVQLVTETWRLKGRHDHQIFDADDFYYRVAAAILVG